ncbi:phosphohistidine phosphatase SixA [soil metagenome]
MLSFAFFCQKINTFHPIIRTNEMTKSLFLVRHAQAIENTGRQSDIHRILTPQGYREATRLGRKIFEMDIHPDIILASHSERTRTTAELIAEQIKFDIQKINFKEDLYEASTRTLFTLIRSLNDDWNTIMIVGHNPSISYFAEYITHQEIGHVAHAGVVHLSFDLTSWSQIDEGNGNYLDYFHPEMEE